MQLKPAQIKSLAYHIRTPRSLDRSDPGTGKTAPACMMTAYVVTRENHRVIWIQSSSIAAKNRDELILWTGLATDQVTLVDGTKARREKLIAQDSKVWLMGAEAFNQFGEDMLKMWPDIQTVIVDEAHLYYSNFQSRRTQSFLKLVEKLERVIMLTATPIKNGNLASAYTYCYLLNRKFYRSLSEFMTHHAVRDSFQEVVGWINHETLTRFFGKHTIKHSRRDVYGDIEIFVDRQELDMLPVQRKAYLEFAELGLLDFANAILDGKEPGVKALRLRQICNHPHKIVLPVEVNTKGDVVRTEQISLITPTTKTPKIQFILDWLLTNEGMPLIVFAPLIFEQQAIVATLTNAGIKVGLINGGVSGPERTRQDTEFRSGGLQVMVCSPKTAGIGFNWGHVDTIIYHSLDYGDQDYTQSLSRAVRGIREVPLQLIILEYKESIDSHLLWAVHHKSITTNKVDSTCGVIYFPRPKCQHTLADWDGKMTYSA